MPWDWHETPTDRRWQEAIIRRFVTANGGGYDVKMMPRECEWDGELYRAGVLAMIVEVKRRGCKRFKYRTYLIDRRKIDAGGKEAAQRGVPFWLLVGFADGYCKVQITREFMKTHVRRNMMQRLDRHQEQADLAYEWSNTLWTPLGEPIVHDVAETVREIGRHLGVTYDEQGRAR